jgi:hypothetical protein
MRSSRIGQHFSGNSHIEFGSFPVLLKAHPMSVHLFEDRLLESLTDIEELALSGFSVRPGLTRAGVTLLRGRVYFGAWRVSNGALVWTYANAGDTSYFAATVEDAVRHTMLMVLRNLETARSHRAPAYASAR